MWQVFILVICFGVYLLAGAVISYCFWYLLLLVFRPLKLERLFGIELPLPIVLSLLGIGIWYGYNINNFLSESSSKKVTTERNENVPIKKTLLILYIYVLEKLLPSIIVTLIAVVSLVAQEK